MRTISKPFQKLILALLLPAALLFSSYDTVLGPLCNFDKLTHDFGSFKEGQVVETTFTLKNTGDKDLIITSVEQPCGCTIPSWTQEPIPVGSSGQIKVRYNSADRPGPFRKTLRVYTNCGRPDEVPLLMIKGTAQPKK